MSPARPATDTLPSDVAIDLTTEIRWFFDGRLPPEVVAWFTAGGRGLVEDRCDTYRLDGQADIGVKWRSKTTLELKLRLGRPEAFTIGPELDGMVETWQRWSPADAMLYLNDCMVWVDLDKTVIKRRFDGTGRELLLSEENRAMTGQGCDAEIALVSVGDRVAWTFAFAAFGPPANRRRSLERAWRALTERQPRPQRLRLSRYDSVGYPEWMAGDPGLPRS